MAEIESKSERGDWEIGLCQKENTSVTTYRATYLKHLQHVGNEIKKIFLYFIPVGPVGLMEL